MPSTALSTAAAAELCDEQKRSAVQWETLS